VVVVVRMIVMMMVVLGHGTLDKYRSYDANL
jgi:hypothetical protein